MSTVHVMMEPLDDTHRVRELNRKQERLCTDPDLGQQVVFHPRAERFGAYTRCPDCGETDAERV